MKFHIITIFPKIFDSYINESIIARAQKENYIEIEVHNLRDWTTDKHKTVDDTPYGGGAGMLMKVDVVHKALRAITGGRKKKSRKILLMSAKGRKWNQQTAREYSSDIKEIVFICGRYEGIDDRILEFVDEEVSIGDFVLTGGELPALTILDSIARLIPGVLGNQASFEDESHSIAHELEYPQYTRPEVFTIGKKKYKVPEVLLSGNHKLISEWRDKHKKRSM